MVVSGSVEAIAEGFRANGVAMVEYLLTEATLVGLERVFAGAAGCRHGRISVEIRSAIAASDELSMLANGLLGAPGRLVRIVAFDTSPDVNWFVPWHQDRTIALARAVETSGFRNWTTKDGIVSAEPPVSLLEAMVTLRIHLDPCDADAGPLEVVPGTHARGLLDKAAIEIAAGTAAPLICLAERGDVLAMRPLLLHRSQRARLPRRRRVLHLDYCAGRLPAGLDWSLSDIQPSEMTH